MRHYDPNDTSTVRKYRVGDGDTLYMCEQCDTCTTHDGYLFEIYDQVIDVAGVEHPIVTDARLITTVFVCDECYRKRTVQND